MYQPHVPSSLTIGKHARRCELDVGKSSQMVEHSTAVTVLLGIVHKRSNVVLLTVVANAGAYHHGDVIC